MGMVQGYFNEMKQETTLFLRASLLPMYCSKDRDFTIKDMKYRLFYSGLTFFSRHLCIARMRTAREVQSKGMKWGGETGRPWNKGSRVLAVGNFMGKRWGI